MLSGPAEKPCSPIAASDPSDPCRSLRCNMSAGLRLHPLELPLRKGEANCEREAVCTASANL